MVGDILIRKAAFHLMQENDYPFCYQFAKADVTASVLLYYLQTSGHSVWETLSVIGIVRGKDPFINQTALPGGFLNVGLETLRHCGFREAFLEEIVWRKGGEINGNLRDVYGHFGLKLPDDSVLTLLCEQSAPARDPRVKLTGAPVIDHVYTAELPWEVFEFPSLGGGDDAKRLIRMTYIKNNLPTRNQIRSQWAFDHGEAIIMLLEKMLWLQPQPKEVKCPTCSGSGKVLNV